MAQYNYCLPDSPESDRLVIVTEDSEDSAGGTTGSEGSRCHNTAEQLPSFNWFQNQPDTVTNKWYITPSSLCESNESSLDIYLDNEQASNVTTKPSASSVPNGQTLNMQATPCETSTPVTNEQKSCLEFSSADKDKCAEKQSSVNSDPGSFLIDHILRLDQFPNFALKKPTSEIMAGTSGKLNVDEKGDNKDNINKTKVRRSDKPPYTYVAMIAVAIMHSKNGHLSLPAIREKLKTFFPFFNGDYLGWKNSVRHALSNSKCFYKMEFCDKTDMSLSNVWKVMHSSLKQNTFRRQDTALNAGSYKRTLQEELGLPPFVSNISDLCLPPKPTFVDQMSNNLQTTDEDDFLNARNENISTPLSVVSEQDSLYPGTTPYQTYAVNSRKRKRCDAPSDYQPAVAMEQQQMCNMYDPYQNMYNAQYVTGQQWSPDYRYYGYQENTPITQQEALPYSWPGNQFYGYEQYYRQWLFNQSFNWSGQYDGSQGLQQSNGEKASALDLSKM